MTRTKPVAATVRCAIYTRKSSDEGLDQSFNSLHAQREACEAYVKSQAAEGWRALPSIYDDGGFSGGTLERPALQRLMEDIRAGQIDTVVVYKVDRLTRSLADFAKIVDMLDTAGASFVSVTQAFNTTNSMGRLTLNVLLSFAQFEREVTGERIRDKIAASKARGMWMGGVLPLGYDVPTDLATRALAVNEAEAETVRLIFRRYLELGSVAALEADLGRQGIKSKRWTSRAGRVHGGVQLGRGALFHLLKNRTYVGEIPHRTASYPGAHPLIVDRALFDAVQAQLANQRIKHRDRPLRSAKMPLTGLIYDADGDRMSPSFGYGKAGKVYRYYVSAPLVRGRSAASTTAAIRRIAAGALENLIRQQLLQKLDLSDDTLLQTLVPMVARVELEPDSVIIKLWKAKLPKSARSSFMPDEAETQMAVLTLPIRARLRGGRTWITTPHDAAPSRRDPVLIKGLRQAHRLAGDMGWMMGTGQLAAADVKAPASAYDRKLCRLAFLAPDLQRAIMDGRQPAGLTLDRLRHSPIPLSWVDQRAMFGS